MAQHSHIMLVFAAVFLAGIGGIAAGIYFMRRAVAATKWTKIRGRVISSEVKRISTTDDLQDGDTIHSVSYRPEVSYEYAVDGKTYQSHQIAILVSTSSNEGIARAVVDKYPAGKEIDIYYNPDKPKDAVLEQSSPGSGWFFIGIGIFFIIIGGIGFCVIFFTGK
jgi:hypothetical protein